MSDRSEDELPELDDSVIAPPDGPAMGQDGTVHHEEPELDLDQIEAREELVLELDDARPAAATAAPPEPELDPELEPEALHRSLIAQATESLRADSGRLLRTGLKAAAWLGIGTVILSHPGVIAAMVGGAVAGDMAIWFLLRIFELPKHLWAFQFEALINLGAVWVMVDVMHLFDSFRDWELFPFGLIAFMLVGIGRFVAWWLPQVAGD